MSNLYYSPTGKPAAQTRGLSGEVRNEFTLIGLAFDKMPTPEQLKSANANYAVDSGAANAYVLTLSPVPAAYTDGMGVVFRTANANTGASTINVNGLGAKNILRIDGTALQAGDILAGPFYTARYSTAQGAFLMEVMSSLSQHSTAAAASASAAAVSATSAASSASSASGSASSASTSATNAANSASSMTQSVNVATTKASEASSSATNAATSANTATTKATEAGASATAAGTSATNAASSATAAATSATNAATSASAAATSASNAASDASSVASALASIAGGPVASVNGMTGVVTGLATEAFVTAERTASATLSNKTIEAGVFTNGYTEETASASGTAFTFDFASGTVQGFTTTGNATITLPTPAAGKSFQIQVTFGGAHTLAFSGGAVGWPDNTTPPFSGASGKTDAINFVANVAGTKWLGSVIKGYA